MPRVKYDHLSDEDRLNEVEKLRNKLATGRFTTKEIASIRGRIGGLLGKGNPGRRAGGLAGSSKRWNKSALKKSKASK